MVWYRDEFEVGGDPELEDQDLQLDYQFWLAPGIGDSGAERELDNSVHLWLVCYKFHRDDPLPEGCLRVFHPGGAHVVWNFAGYGVARQSFPLSVLGGVFPFPRTLTCL